MTVKFDIKKNKSGYGYIEVGAVSFYKPHHRIWVNNRLIVKDENGEEFVKLAGAGKELIVTEKGNYVLRPSEEINTFIVGRPCGYRGSSWYGIKKGDVKTELPFEDYQSERGSLGVSTYAIVSTPDREIIIDEFADGRLYGDKKVYHKRYFINDKDEVESETIPDCIDDDVCEYLD